MSSKISLCCYNTGHLGLRNETKVVLFSLTISALLGFTQVPNSIQYAYGAGCAPEDVQHWNQVRFLYAGDDPLVSNTNPEIPVATQFDIWILRDGLSVSTIRTAIVDKLTELGYTEKISGNLPSLDDVSVISNDSTYYSSFCDSFGLAQVIGGALIQPDTATLVLAYGIANSIWLVPSVAGIGIAVYLVKRRF